MASIAIKYMFINQIALQHISDRPGEYRTSNGIYYHMLIIQCYWVGVTTSSQFATFKVLRERDKTYIFHQ